MAHTVNVYFARVTPESAEDGDFSDTGVVDEGVSLEPDKWEREEGFTAVDLAVKLLQKAGATEPSSSHFHKGIWYATGFEVVSYRTGEEEERTYHLKGFTEREEREVFDAIAR
jgi:hypothetical protein